MVTDLFAWLSKNAEAVAIVLFVVLWGVANLWKFAEPSTPGGRALLWFLTKLTFTAWNAWGVKQVRWPWLPTPDLPSPFDQDNKDKP